MFIKKLFPALLLLHCLQPVNAQKKVILEKLRNETAIGLYAYWQNAEIRKTFVQQLGGILWQHRQLILSDTARFAVQPPGNARTALPATMDFVDTDTSHAHLYLDLLEFAPGGYFAAMENERPDSAFISRIKNLFFLRAVLVNSHRAVLFDETLHIAVSHVQTAGLGTMYGNGQDYHTLSVTPKGFTEMLKAAANILFNPANTMEIVEIKVPPAYYADNYILPRTMNRPRVYVSTTKDISIYSYHDNREMLRLGDALYEEVRTRGKKAEKYPEAITAAIKNANNSAISDFVFLRQEGRDVIRNRDYLLKMIVQLDPENVPLMPLYAFTHFLPGNVHVLLDGQDTLAAFAIAGGVTERENILYADKVSNGFDSSSFFVLPVTPPASAPVLYDYVVTGKISDRPFSIKCSGYRNTVKEIYLGGALVCIAQGKFTPEKFVVFDASLSPELLNQLFLIGFNRFFE